jgi:integrase
MKMRGDVSIRFRCKKCGLWLTPKREDPEGWETVLCPNCSPLKQMLYFIDFYDGEKQIRLFSDEHGQTLDSMVRALKVKRRIEGELQNGTFKKENYKASKNPGDRLSVTANMEFFLAEKLKTLAPSSLPVFKTLVRRAQDFFKDANVETIRKINLLQYKSHLEATHPNLSQKHIRNHLVVMRSFLNWLKQLEVINIVPPMPEIEVEDAPINWLAAEDQLKILEQIDIEDRPFFLFLILQGVRPGECRALKIKDIDLRTNSIRIHATFSGSVYREKRKGRKKVKAAVIPIHPELIDFLKDRVEKEFGENWVFINRFSGEVYSTQRLRNIWAKASKAAGIRARIYDMRHSFASQLINAGVPIFGVSKLLGHSDIRTTEKYSHANLEQLRSNLAHIGFKKADQRRAANQ